MDEKRRFFRIKNKGEMLARFEDRALHIIELSAGSAAIAPDMELPQTGRIELKINQFKINLHYDILRADEEKMILIFNEETHIEKLLAVLKNFRKDNE